MKKKQKVHFRDGGTVVNLYNWGLQFESRHDHFVVRLIIYHLENASEE